jgi:hypothetical protein
VDSRLGEGTSVGIELPEQAVSKNRNVVTPASVMVGSGTDLHRVV